MELIGKIFGLGIIIAVTDIILAEAGRKDIAFVLTLAGITIAMVMVVFKINEFFNTVTTMFGF